MKNIAAIRWLPNGRTKHPVIQYMVLDTDLQYLIFPTEIVVTHVKTAVKELLFVIEEGCKNGFPLEVHYKSIVTGYWKPRRDSRKFHKLLTAYLIKKKLVHYKLAFLLKKNHLAFFKKALYFLDIDCKSKGEAYVAHLWTIALHVTKGNMHKTIKQLWKSRYSIKRMTKEQISSYTEFFNLL